MHKTFVVVTFLGEPVYDCKGATVETSRAPAQGKNYIGAYSKGSFGALSCSYSCSGFSSIQFSVFSRWHRYVPEFRAKG